METACERLTYAEKRLKEKGWMQGNFRKSADHRRYVHDGPACLMGALVTDEELDAGPALVRFPGVLEAVQAMGFPFSYFVWSWNDHEDRTLDEVLDRINRGKAKVCQEAQ